MYIIGQIDIQYELLMETIQATQEFEVVCIVHSLDTGSDLDSMCTGLRLT